MRNGKRGNGKWNGNAQVASQCYGGQWSVHVVLIDDCSNKTSAVCRQCTFFQCPPFPHFSSLISHFLVPTFWVTQLVVAQPKISPRDFPPVPLLGAQWSVHCKLTPESNGPTEHTSTSSPVRFQVAYFHAGPSEFRIRLGMRLVSASRSQCARSAHAWLGQGA